LIVVAGVLFVGLILFLARGRHREVDRSQFQHAIQGFVQMKKDGGRLTLEHPRTQLRVSLVRQNEVEQGCEVLVKLQEPKWLQWRDRLFSELDRNLFEPRIDCSEEPCGLELTVPIPDVRAPEAGARAARALLLIFEVVGIGEEDRFRITSTGENSIRVWRPAAERWVEGGNPVLKGVGRSTLRGLERERREREEAKEKRDVREGSVRR